MRKLLLFVFALAHCVSAQTKVDVRERGAKGDGTPLDTKAI